MGSSVNFPVGRDGSSTTVSVADLIAGLALPSIEPLGTDIAAMAGLPDLPVPDPRHCGPRRGAADTAQPAAAEAVDPAATVPDGAGAGSAALRSPVAGPSAGVGVVESRLEGARALMDGCTDAIAALHKHQNQCAALAAVLIARLESTAVLEGGILAVDSWQYDISLMSMRADLAGILSVSEGVAGQLILHAGTLVNYLPATMESLSSGWLGWDYAVIIAQETSLLREAGLAQETVDAFEQVLLGKAAGATLPSFREKARRRRERFYPETITPKTRREYSQRRLGVSRARDGMSWLSLYAPAPTVEAIWAQCTLTAQAAQGPHEERTLTQLRADVAAALLLNQSMAENQIYAPTQPNTTNTAGTADGTSNAATTTDGTSNTASTAAEGTTTDGTPNGAGAGTGPAAANGAADAAGTATGDAQGPWFAPVDPAADGVPLDPGPEPEPDPAPEPVPIRDRGPDWDYVARRDRGVVDVPDRWVPVFDDPDYSDPGFKDPDIRNGPDWDPAAIPPTLTPPPSSADNAITTADSASSSANLASITGGEGTTASNTTNNANIGTNNGASGAGASTGSSAAGGGACVVGPVWPPMPQVTPVLLIPALSLLGATNEPAWLEGYGPLSMEVARHLAAGAPSLLRVLVDPISNEPLDVAPQRYRINTAMRTMLQIRDEYCQFPGCLAKATNCEIDHIKKFEHGGLSIYDNLETLCHRHHVLKHFKDDRTRTGECRTDQSPEREAVRLRGWTPAIVAGRVAWTSPTGRYYPPEVGDTQPPVYPEWLKTHINKTLGQPDSHNNTGQNTAADPASTDPESAPEFHEPPDPQEPQDFHEFDDSQDFLDFAVLDEDDIPGMEQDDDPYARPLPVPPPGTFPTDEEQAALDKETLANYLVSHPDMGR
ncbi:DUF222 domain-containing protein [Specibacter sp. AOP5-B1-6]|uniref:DUF222 domain-containing protein n=1 Tax=Specibacter sp. AOP5-B1-6 TaxID=3457653 RepID=UPI00402BCD71